jgi:hypothetical protein
MPAGIIASQTAGMLGMLQSSQHAKAQAAMMKAHVDLQRAMFDRTRAELSGGPREMSAAECDALVAYRNARTRKVEAEAWTREHQRRAREIADAGRKLMRRIERWAFVARFFPLAELIVDRLTIDLVLLVDECDSELALAGVK